MMHLIEYPSYPVGWRSSLGPTLVAFGYSRDAAGRPVVRETVRAQRDDTPPVDACDEWRRKGEEFKRRHDWHDLATAFRGAD